MIEELYRLAFAALRHHLDVAKVAFSEDDGDLLFADHRLGLSIAFECFERLGEQVLAPLDVQIHLDGDEGDRFRIGALGVGADRAAAMADGISEWHLLAAAPVLAALGAPAGARLHEQAPRQVAGWDFFPGRIGIRGPIPAELAAGGGFFRTLLRVLQEEASRWPLPEIFELRSIYIMASSSQGTCEVQAAINGFLNPDLVQALGQLAWPTAAEAYLYKQLFVFRAGK